MQPVLAFYPDMFFVKIAEPVHFAVRRCCRLFGVWEFFIVHFLNVAVAVLLDQWIQIKQDALLRQIQHCRII